MANENLNIFNRAGTVADQASFDVGLRAHMVRVYNYMASGLALSGIVAFGLFSSAELASLFFQVARLEKSMSESVTLLEKFMIVKHSLGDESKKKPGDGGDAGAEAAGNPAVKPV